MFLAFSLARSQRMNQIRYSQNTISIPCPMPWNDPAREDSLNRNRKMKRVFAICLFAASTALVGCGEPKPTSVMESSDKAAIAEYERLLAEQDAAAEASPPDAEESTETPAP